MKKSIAFLFITLCFFIQTSFAQEPIRIGIIQPLTGSTALDGQALINGVDLALDQVGKDGVLGRKIELIIEDGRCMPSESRAAAEKLITRDKVHAIIGAFCSTATLSAKPVVTKYGIPMVGAIPTSPKLLEEPIKYFFRMPPGTKALAKASVKPFIDATKTKTVCTLTTNDDGGRDHAQRFSDAFEENGIKVLSKDYYSYNETDFLPFITKIKGLNPDSVFVLGMSQDAALMAKQMKEQGLRKPILGAAAVVEANFIQLAGDACEGWYGVAEWAPGIQDALNIAFVRDYAKLSKRYAQVGPPGKYPAGGYDAFMIIADAIKRSGGTDPEKLVTAIEGTNLRLLHGPNFRFDNHRGLGNVVFYQIKGGKVQVIAHVPAD